MRSTDAQVRKLMNEYNRHGKLERAALRAGMHRSTASKYVHSGKLPSETVKPRHWRTRKNPFDGVWAWIEEQLTATPTLEVTTLFELLQQKFPNQFQPGQVRTLQRLIRQWRVYHGPQPVAFFQQVHRPGEAAQTDFTHASELQITIGGEVFHHLLCVFTLPYSNWTWVTVCLSESLAALRRGIQSALFRLGRVPLWHQTDNSTAATHDLQRGPASSKERIFNEDYCAIMRHFGMQPRTIEVGESHQNGDVEARNGALKNRLNQMLLVRGSRDFSSREAYEEWVQSEVQKIDQRLMVALEEELVQMKVLPLSRLPEFIEREFTVTKWSTLYVGGGTYSVPSRFIRERVNVRMFEERLEIYHGNQLQFTLERARGKHRVNINYRHLIWSLVQKPGAFARYKYRDEMFPTVVFRQAYDAIVGERHSIQGDLNYLRILHLAATTEEHRIEQALQALLHEKVQPTIERVRSLLALEPAVSPPKMEELLVDLHGYNVLLPEVCG